MAPAEFLEQAVVASGPVVGEQLLVRDDKISRLGHGGVLSLFPGRREGLQPVIGNVASERGVRHIAVASTIIHLPEVT
jgi:hypothetical protein